MMMKNTLVALALAAPLAACITHESANVYSKHEAGREQTVRMATVDSVRKVVLEGSQSGVGGAAGGAVGGIAGSQVGHGAGSNVAAVLGAVAGGVAGNALEHKATTKDALEITVRLDSGTSPIFTTSGTAATASFNWDTSAVAAGVLAACAAKRSK